MSAGREAGVLCGLLSLPASSCCLLPLLFPSLMVPVQPGAAWAGTIPCGTMRTACGHAERRCKMPGELAFIHSTTPSTTSHADLDAPHERAWLAVLCVRDLG